MHRPPVVLEADRFGHACAGRVAGIVEVGRHAPVGEHPTRSGRDQAPGEAVTAAPPRR